MRRPEKLREWLLRYGPAEIASTAATLAAALLARCAGLGEVASALAATWAGNLTYYGLILTQDIRQTRQELSNDGRSYTVRTFGRNARALFIEFGPAEALDSLLVRPALMYWLPRCLHSVPCGVLTAKFAADVTFYIPAVIGYEWSKRKLRTF